MAESDFERLWLLGYRRLVPIIPPNTPISERSGLYKRLQNGRDDRGKAPGVRWPDGSWSGFDWLPHEAEPRDLARWAAMGAGVGIKTGNGLVLIDADTLDAGSAVVIGATVDRHFGRVPLRIGRSPKAGYVLRCEGTFQYSRIEFGERDAKGNADRVEILSDGRQFVAEGIHPITGKPYRWERPLVPWGDLPATTPEALNAFLDDLRGLLPAASPIIREGAATSVSQSSLKAPLEAVRKAVAATPNTSANFPGRDQYRDYGYAIKAALPDHPDEALELFQDWAASWDGFDWSTGSDPRQLAEAEWRRMKPPFRRGASWLFEMAGKVSGSFGPSDIWFEEVVEPEPLFPDDGPKALETPSITPTAYKFPDPSAIPPRDWLYPGHMVRKFLSATIAPGGIGKSSNAIVEALALASGRALLGVKPKEPARVWYWNGEDPMDELERRIAAAMTLHGLSRADIGNRLLVDSGRDQPFTLATQTREGAKVYEVVASRLISVLREQAIDVMIVDPFVSSHAVPENDNGAMDAVAKKWGFIADRANCAIEIIHHARKTNGAEVTIDDARGAVALIAAARSARALTRMTKQEAAGLSDDVRRRVFRFSDAKQNLAPPASGDFTRWFETASVALGNGAGTTPVEQEMNGDSVGVVRAFDKAWADEAQAPCGGGEREAVALEEAAKGVWKQDSRAGDQWFGSRVAAAYGLDAANPNDKRQVKAIIARPERERKIAFVERNDQNRNPRVFVILHPEFDANEHGAFG